MRRRLAALLILPALALTATACGSDDGKKDSADKADSSSPAPKAAEVPKAVDTANPMPKVTGDIGKKATISVPKGDPSGKFVVHTLSEGSGAEVKKNDLVSMNFTGKIWKDGKDLGSSYDAKGRAQTVTAGGSGQVPAFAQAVLGQKEGSRVLVVAPPAAAYGSQGQPQFGISGTDTLVFAIDVGKVVPKKVEGTQAAIPSNLPQIKADKEEPATISIPKNDPPTKLVDQVLIKGKGAEIKTGQTVSMQYSGAAWKLNEGKAKATLFDSSWNRGGQPLATPIGQGQVIPGWDKGIVGKHVGDRVLLVIPPDMGYGKEAKDPKTLPANSTLVFVVDILSAG